MKLVVFGATGGTGSAVVERALADGHEVVAAVRRPDAVPQRDRLVTRHCDVLDAASVADAIDGGDAVVSTIGPDNNRRPGTLISTGVGNIIAGCADAGVSRFVFESGLMVSDGQELSLSGRLGVRLVGLLLATLKADKQRAEAAIRSSPLEWVIVRPPNLTRSSVSADCIAEPAARISPAKAISQADCAAALVRGAADPRWVRQVVNVGRP